MSYQVVLQKSPNIPLGVEENTKYSFSLFSWIKEDIREEKKKRDHVEYLLPEPYNLNLSSLRWIIWVGGVS